MALENHDCARRRHFSQQLELPCVQTHGLLELRRFVRRHQRRQWKRPSQQERRLMAARRDPRQVSIYGAEHEKELHDHS